MAASPLSGPLNNWQSGKTLAECNLHMLQEEHDCDVTFRCGTEGHAVKAHRYMLISRSCVFHTMLTGAMAENPNDVKIPDIEPEFFKAFLRYIYTDDTDINADNVTALLYTARKYGVTSLETKCSKFLDLNISPENACVILQAAHCFDQKQLYEKTLTLIKSQGERSLQSPGFQELSQVLVDEIVGSDDLVADEHVIFTAVNDWSEAECERVGREVTPESKRSVMGDILMKVRFPLIDADILADIVKQSRLLTDEEGNKCFELAASRDITVTPFSNKHRTKVSFLISKTRFFDALRPISWKCDGRIDAIRFTSNSKLYIFGFQLYGKYLGKGKSTYNVTSYLGYEDNVLSCVVQERTEYTSEGDVFDVIFSRPVSVSAGEWYTLAVEMEGPHTHRGEEGQEKVESGDGVELQFMDSKHSTNRTGIRKGQIPSLLYRKIKAFDI